MPEEKVCKSCYWWLCEQTRDEKAVHYCVKDMDHPFYEEDLAYCPVIENPRVYTCKDWKTTK